MGNKGKTAILEKRIMNTLNEKGNRFSVVQVTEKADGLRFDMEDEKYYTSHIMECKGYSVDSVLEDAELYEKLIKEVKNGIRESVLAMEDAY